MRYSLRKPGQQSPTADHFSFPHVAFLGALAQSRESPTSHAAAVIRRPRLKASSSATTLIQRTEPAVSASDGATCTPEASHRSDIQTPGVCQPPSGANKLQIVLRTGRTRRKPLSHHHYTPLVSHLQVQRANTCPMLLAHPKELLVVSVREKENI